MAIHLKTIEQFTIHLYSSFILINFENMKLAPKNRLELLPKTKHVDKRWSKTIFSCPSSVVLKWMNMSIHPWLKILASVIHSSPQSCFISDGRSEATCVSLSGQFWVLQWEVISEVYSEQFGEWKKSAESRKQNAFPFDIVRLFKSLNKWCVKLMSIIHSYF